jgi:hypothetical protein
MLRASSDQESGLKNVVDVYIWCSVVALCEHMLYPLEGLFSPPEFGSSMVQVVLQALLIS